MSRFEEADAAPLSARESDEAACEIRRCYASANPEKLSDGSVDELLVKYKGEERLLLRRVRHRYGLVCKRGRLARRTGSARAAADWVDVEVALRADGLLRWADDGGGVGSLDARRAAVDVMDEGLAGRPFAFAVFSVGGDGDDAAADDAASFFFAAADERERDAWRTELAETAAFFRRLDRERACQREEEAIVRSALETSELAERDRLRELDRVEALETKRTIAASQLDEEQKRRVADLPIHKAGLEAALDDALRFATDANGFEAKRKHRKAHDMYARAVAAFVLAKQQIRDMPPDARPEKDVLDLIDSGSAQCRQAADACRARGAKKPPPPPASAADTDDARNPPSDPFADAGAALQDEPRRVPASVRKLILDADDV